MLINTSLRAKILNAGYTWFYPEQNSLSKYSALYLIHKNLQRNIITVRKRSLRRLCFYTCLPFCSQGGGCLGPGPGPGGCSGPGLGGCPAQARGVQAQAQGYPGPGPGGCVSQHALRQTPLSRRLLLRTVRIQLECILVLSVYNFFWVFKEVSFCKSLIMCHKKNQNL